MRDRPEYIDWAPDILVQKFCENNKDKQLCKNFYKYARELFEHSEIGKEVMVVLLLTAWKEQ